MNTSRQAKRASKRITAKAAFRLANEYCLLHYAPAFTGGSPYHLALPSANLWVVPVLLTSAGFGIVGDVGVIALDTNTGDVVSAPERAAVFSAAKRLDKEKRHDLEAAFHRARGGVHLRPRLSANAAGAPRYARK